jgi:hypothetical protein
MGKVWMFLLCIAVALFCMGASVQQTADGGYVVIGSSQTYTNGASDFLVYKLNGAGVKDWRRNYGGSDGEDGEFIRQTADGGYIIAGSTWTYTHGHLGRGDMLIYRVDSSGVELWRKNFGGEDTDRAKCVQATSDGGYIVVGHGTSYTNGDYDVLVYKLDADGNKQWRKNFGGSDYDSGKYVIQTSDGGYLICGSTQSYTTGSKASDFLLYKLDANGNKQWRKNLGGDDNESAYCVQQTPGGTYVVAGYTGSYVHGDDDTDMLIYHLSSTGGKIWRKNFGGEHTDRCSGVKQAADGGFFIAGSTRSYVHGNPGEDFDFLVYRLGATGAKLWRKNLGGESYDQCAAVDVTSDGGVVLFGDTSSYVHGGDGTDFLVYKLNGSGAKLWRRNLGGENDEFTSE